MDEKVQETEKSQEPTAVGASSVTQASREAPKLTKVEEIRRKSADYLETVSGGKKLDPEDKNYIVKHTLENFDDYFNRGFLHYRKSVAEAEDFAAIEWTGQGSIIEDIMGRKFIDCLGGFGVYNMGIRHPKIIDAVQAQLKRMPLSSQELLDPLRGFLAELLGELAPGDLQECFFISNGTDAVEGALKLARLHTKKTGFISTTGGFHGKSMGSLSVMGRAVYRKPFQPLLSGVHFVDYGDIKDLEREMKKLLDLGEDIAAIILEPVQGEAGAVVPPDDYLPRIRQLCDEYNVLMILDEVQTGMGRTGKVFGCEHWNVVPDILCLGKALGGGVMPLSAFMSTPKIWKVLEENPFLHSSTFGGNPLACAAGIAAINVMLEENLPQQAAEKGAYLMKRLRSFQALYPEFLKVVRGKGLLIGLEFADRFVGYRVAAGLFKRGVLVAGTLLSARTIRIEPALNISYELLDEMLDKLADTLKEIDKQLDKEAKEKASKDKDAKDGKDGKGG
ncbi:MAG TPA: putrescine aminotransferase [Verrucomicrobiae bacterium]|nr:putrescine aminotransferase [Verrucomicrobiae bacterium]